MKTEAAINIRQFLLGLLALSAGALEYLLHRPVGTTTFGSTLFERLGTLPDRVDLFGSLAGVAPEFLHPFAFCLFTMSIVPGAKATVRIGICLAWLTIELFFEIGQWAGSPLSTFIQSASQGHDPFGVVAYFSGGTFDPLDVFAICMGVLAAYLFGKITSVQRLYLKEV